MPNEQIINKVVVGSIKLNKININSYCNILLKDKKTLNGIPNFVLTRGPGSMFLKEIKLDNRIKKILSNYFEGI